jgi:hypothetical protein
MKKEGEKEEKGGKRKKKRVVGCRLAVMTMIFRRLNLGANQRRFIVRAYTRPQSQKTAKPKLYVGIEYCLQYPQPLPPPLSFLINLHVCCLSLFVG